MLYLDNKPKRKSRTTVVEHARIADSQGPWLTDLSDIVFAQLHKHKVPHPVLHCWPPLTLESRVLRGIALIVCAVHKHALASIQIAGVLQLHHHLHIQRELTGL